VTTPSSTSEEATTRRVLTHGSEGGYKRGGIGAVFGTVSGAFGFWTPQSLPEEHEPVGLAGDHPEHRDG
jgi:hypothetical protein